MTMSVFSTSELSRMQDTQESAMMDTCVRLRYAAGTADGYGYAVPSWTEAEEYDCGLDVGKRDELLDETQVTAEKAVLRLPIDAEISELDRLRITHRFGVELDESVDYEIVGEPRRGPSGLLVTIEMVVHERG